MAGNGRDKDTGAGAPIGPEATAAPDSGGIRGFPPERQSQYPVAGGAVDQMDRRADEEEASTAAHEPLGPGGFVEERDLTGGPATAFAGRTADPTHEPEIPVDLVIETPDAGPGMAAVLPPRATEEELGEEFFPEPANRAAGRTGSHWLAPFGTTLQHTREWMRDVASALGTTNPRDARQALHAVLTTLRDQLPVEEVADFSAALPLPLRGLLFEGWTGHTRKLDTRKELLATLEHRLGSRARLDPEEALRGVLDVIRRRVPAGELEDIEGVLPTDLKWMMEPV